MKNIQSLSVIVTTYNQPLWLERTLWAFEAQTVNNFEIIIADDGSNEETKSLIERFQKEANLKIKHVWHPDNGFQKCVILNKAIVASESDYLLFTDGDCLPRADFVQKHLENARIGYFLSGGYFKLNSAVSHLVTKSDIQQQLVFSSKWLHKNGQPSTYKFLKLQKKHWISAVLNYFTTTKPTWNGHNVSGWKKDIIAVNGYNEEMMYGGLDRELGERLENYGIKGLQIRYSAIVLHLDHPRPYKKSELIAKNRAIRKHVREDKVIFTSIGIDQYLK